MNPESLQSPALSARHGFFTRRGGVSTGPFASLNCSVSSADDPAHVAANRAAVAASLGATSLLGATQTHGIDVATVVEPWLPGHGPRADALVTRPTRSRPRHRHRRLHPRAARRPLKPGIIGAVHAGWRGALAGVLEATVATMRALGANIHHGRDRPVHPPAQLRGPRRPSRRRPRPADPADARFFLHGRPDHWQFDLAGYCAARLVGLAEVDTIAADTAAEPERFFSHRRRTLEASGPIGHQISTIVL